MSTGLTYVVIIDEHPVQAPAGGVAIQVFASYDEAYALGEWLTDGTPYSQNVLVSIITFSPSQSGYWFNGTFTPKD